MTQKEFTTTVLNAEEGMYLTQTNEVEIQERIVATTVAIGINDSPNNWCEISQEEADNIRKAQEEYRKAEEARIEAEMKTEHPTDPIEIEPLSMEDMEGGEQ